jgi:hypothetical protein
VLPYAHVGGSFAEIRYHPYLGAATREPLSMLAPPARSPTCREPAQQCAAMRRMPLWHLNKRSAHKTGELLLCPQPARRYVKTPSRAGHAIVFSSLKPTFDVATET